MKAIIPVLDEKSSRPLYLQLYDYIKKAILSGEMIGSEKLPSLRNLSKSLKMSLTTVELAYSQLAVEGYIYSVPQSGFYVSNVKGSGPEAREREEFAPERPEEDPLAEEMTPLLYDLSCFDFNKWKKCANKIYTEYPQLMLFESDPQGESALRRQIAKYLYRSRGVQAAPDQIVIGAGTQQITGQLSLLLSDLSLRHVAVEDPGYLPVQKIFRDRGFLLTPVEVGRDGIAVQKLPQNIRSAVYVSPSNQFPTGAVMPVGRRYELLEWAERNDSIIIEDDYDSELRYFGKPIPALQGLDLHQRVVYLGSFSSTLFPSIKISYMVLPQKLADLFALRRDDYTQTCSKAEQLTLALFMEYGYYQTNIRKLRSLYAQKLQAALAALQKCGEGLIRPAGTTSGINMILRIKSEKSAETLCKEAARLGLLVLPMTPYSQSGSALIFYYNQIPLKQIDRAVAELSRAWL